MNVNMIKQGQFDNKKFSHVRLNFWGGDLLSHVHCVHSYF